MFKHAGIRVVHLVRFYGINTKAVIFEGWKRF